MELEKWRKLVEQWQGLIAAIGLLVAGIVALSTKLLEWNPLAWSWPELSLLLLAILLVAGLTVRSRRANASRLIDPDALKLDPRSPEQLIGRREDLDRLLNALANPLVFLVSESGCGKSALLRAGVAQGPAFTDRFLPIYIDMSVLDWADGPLRAVREGFSRALPADDRARATLDKQSGPTSYAQVFADYRRRTLRRPLLLLDQFDDYQAQPRHRDRFLPRDTRVWRTAGTVARDNAFWRVLRQCLTSDSVSVIIACREDAVAGMESVRFHPDVPQFDLPRLEPGLVRMIIDRLTDRPADQPAVIANPQNGWTALRDRLADDLEVRGQLLPQQLKVVLGGIRTLHRLTPSAYARIGRVAGLEAAYVDGALKRAAQAATLSYDDVLRLILGLVDRTRQPPDKAPPQPAADLATIIGATEDAAARALKRLEADEVVRPCGDAEGETTSWQLDHAYLAQPILHIDRERDQWRRLLAERARAYAEAAWRDKCWGALLPLRTQGQLLTARLRGRFRYGEHRAYALISLTRGLPAIAAVGLAAALYWGWGEYEAAAQIEAQLAQIGGDDGDGRVSDAPAAGLANLATRSWITRWRVTRDVFTSPAHAEWFASRPEPILRALVGLDPARLEALVKAYVTTDALHHPDYRLSMAAAALVRVTPFGVLAEGTKVAFERALTENLNDNPDNINPAAIVDGVRVIAAALPSDDQRVIQWLAALRDAIGKTNDFYQLEALAQAYAAMVTKVKEDDPRAAEVLAVLRTAIRDTTDSCQLADLAQAYAAAANKVKDGDPRAADELAALRDAVGKTADFDHLAALAEAYAAVATKVKDADLRAGEVLAPLRDAIGKTRYGPADLARAYAAVATKLKDGDPRAANELAALHDAIGKNTSSFRLAALAQADAAVATKVTGGDPRVVDVLAALRDAIKTADASQAPDLAKAYATVATTLRDGDPRAVDELAALRDAIVGRADDMFWPLEQAYAAVATKVKEGDPRVAAELAALRGVIGTATLPFQLAALAQTYAALATKVKEGDPRAADELGAVRDTIGKTTGPDQLSNMQFTALAEAYSAVATTLKHGEPRAAVELAALRDVIGRTIDPRHLPPLAQAYAAVATKVTGGDPRAVDVLAALRDAIGKTTNSFQLQFLAQAYAAVVRAAPRAIVPERDIALLLARMHWFRYSGQVEAFAAAIKEAIRLGQPSLSWDRVGLIYTAMLLQPVAAGAPSRQLVTDYEEMIPEHQGPHWEGDVWAFAVWARDNLPGFDPHRPRLGFLPPPP